MYFWGTVNLFALIESMLISSYYWSCYSSSYFCSIFRMFFSYFTIFLFSFWASSVSSKSCYIFLCCSFCFGPRACSIDIWSSPLFYGVYCLYPNEKSISAFAPIDIWTGQIGLLILTTLGKVVYEAKLKFILENWLLGAENNFC